MPIFLLKVFFSLCLSVAKQRLRGAQAEATGDGVEVRIHRLILLPFSGYTSPMGTKLTSANPYLRDPNMRDRMVFESVASSSAIEGIRAPFKQPFTVDQPLPKNRAVKKKSSR